VGRQRPGLPIAGNARSVLRQLLRQFVYQEPGCRQVRKPARSWLLDDGEMTGRFLNDLRHSHRRDRPSTLTVPVVVRRTLLHGRHWSGNPRPAELLLVLPKCLH